MKAQHTPGPWEVQEEWGRSREDIAQDIPAVLCFHSIRAVSELQEDYMSVDFDGVTYWIRS